MTRYDWHPRKRQVSLDNVQIRATDATGIYTYQYLIFGRSWLGKIN
jgi:hypothetical protein